RLGQQAAGFDEARGWDGFVAQGLDRSDEPGSYTGLVLDDEHRAHDGAPPRSDMRKQVRPSRLWYVTSPPWVCAIARDSARPRPVPSGLVVKKGSKSSTARAGSTPSPA